MTMKIAAPVLTAAFALAGITLAPASAKAQSYFGTQDNHYSARPFTGTNQDQYGQMERQGQSDGRDGSGYTGIDRDRYGQDQFDQRPYRSGQFSAGANNDARPGRGDGQAWSNGQRYGQGSGRWGADQGASASMGNPNEGVVILLIERDRQQQAMRDLRQRVQEAKTALQQGDKTKAEQALTQAEQTIQQANAAQSAQQVDRSLDRVEQALQRGDRQGAELSLQQARQALHTAAAMNQAAASSSGSAGTTGPGTSGTGALSTGSTGAGSTGGGTTSSGLGSSATGASTPSH